MSLSTSPYNEMFAEDGMVYYKRESKDKRKLRDLLSHKHMVETIERFKWSGLPDELPSDLIERILYFRYKGAFFQYNDKHYFLPFALKGTIDAYGRYDSITPVLFTGQWASGSKKNKEIVFLPESVSGAKFIAKYSKNQEPSEYNAVILTDSSLEVSQDWSPMNGTSKVLIDQMVDILVLLNIDLVTSAKVFYVVAKNEDQKSAIEDEFRDLDSSILDGKRVVVLTSEMELKEITGSQAKDSARYMQSFQSIDNIRKSVIGSDNAGAFLKQEHMTEQETETNSNSASAVLNNALRMRQEFCELVNHFFGLNASVELNGQSEEELIAPQGEQPKQLEGEDQ